MEVNAGAPPQSKAQSSPPKAQSFARNTRQSGQENRPLDNSVASATAGASQAAKDESDVAFGDFVQVGDRARRGGAEILPSNVLSNFQIRRSGQNVSIVDADGSVYEGQVVSGSSARGAGSSGARGGRGGGGGMARPRQESNGASNWFFNVTGNSRNLRQNITVSANVLAMPASASASNAAGANQAASQNETARQGGQAPYLQNSRITARVRAADGKVYQIEARPQSPAIMQAPPDANPTR
jgi:hypothetical protein